MADTYRKYAEVMYGVKPPGEEASAADDDEEDGEDIEASINKELGALRPRQTAQRLFSRVQMNIECLFFIKVRNPVNPVKFVRQICQDAAQTAATSSGDNGQALATRMTRYVNRMTPISWVGKASEKGVEDLARSVLEPWFHLKDATAKAPAEGGEKTRENTELDQGQQVQSNMEDKGDKEDKEDKPMYSVRCFAHTQR